MKKSDCKHERMLPVQVEELHDNGQYYVKEALVCPVCGYTTPAKKNKRYPSDFKVHHARPGGMGQK